MEELVKTIHIQQRLWNRYPAAFVFQPKPDGKETVLLPTDVSIAQNTIEWPKIKFVQHSWDFIPPDVEKPLASSTIGNIAVIV